METILKIKDKLYNLFAPIFALPHGDIYVHMILGSTMTLWYFAGASFSIITFASLILGILIERTQLFLGGINTVKEQIKDIIATTSGGAIPALLLLLLGLIPFTW